VAVEVGTLWGGSLQVLSRLCGRVYSLDTDPDLPGRLAGRFPNVEYIVGPSQQTLPPLLERLARDGEELSFVLVDGDHSAEGVRADLENLLRYRPVTPLFVIMHDSFNPGCRRGMRSANWAANPYVHGVELDFVPGGVTAFPSDRGQMWGGLALAYLKPQERRGHFEVTARGERTFQTALAARSYAVENYDLRVRLSALRYRVANRVVHLVKRVPGLERVLRVTCRVLAAEGLGADGVRGRAAAEV
jgi:hypothetical protein